MRDRTLLRLALTLILTLTLTLTRCEIAPGDALQGDVSAAAAGAVLLESLQRPETARASL